MDLTPNLDLDRIRDHFVAIKTNFTEGRSIEPDKTGLPDPEQYWGA
jgi:hypothetical protein